MAQIHILCDLHILKILDVIRERNGRLVSSIWNIGSFKGAHMTYAKLEIGHVVRLFSGNLGVTEVGLVVASFRDRDGERDRIAAPVERSDVKGNCRIGCRILIEA